MEFQYNSILFLFTLSFGASVHGAMYDGIATYKKFYNLPPLPFKFGGMEPQFDAKTMKIHYAEVHANFTKNMNRLLQEWRTEDKENPLTNESLVEVIKEFNKIPNKWRHELSQQIGGHLNHLFYFATLRANPKNETQEMPKELFYAFKRSFVNLRYFKQQFEDAIMKTTGVGWVWLCRVPVRDYLTVYPTIDNTTPLALAGGLQPVLGIDLWEHAYWIKHPNRKMEYYENWWTNIDWEKVLEIYQWWKAFEKHDEL